MKPPAHTTAPLLPAQSAELPYADAQTANKTVATTFQLCDAVFAKATIKPAVNSVMLWLGANVMLEYDFKEADTLLSTNLKVTAPLSSLLSLSSSSNFLSPPSLPSIHTACPAPPSYPHHVCRAPVFRMPK